MNQIPEWEKEFERYWNLDLFPNVKQWIKDFIRKVESKAKSELVEEIKREVENISKDLRNAKASNETLFYSWNNALEQSACKIDAFLTTLTPKKTN